jgi:hypothetical protein
MNDRPHRMLGDVALDRDAIGRVGFRHVHRAAADDCAAACASAQFRQGHPHRHDRLPCLDEEPSRTTRLRFVA